MDIRKKYMINKITINMTFMMLEPLNGSPAMCETGCQLIGSDGQLIGCDGQLITCDGQLIAVYSNSSVSVFQLISQCFPTNHFTNGWANFSLMAGLHGKPSPAAVGVHGLLHHSRQEHAHQQPSVKNEPISQKNDNFMVLRWSIIRYTGVATLT